MRPAAGGIPESAREPCPVYSANPNIPPGRESSWLNRLSPTLPSLCTHHPPSSFHQDAAWSDVSIDASDDRLAELVRARDDGEAWPLNVAFGTYSAECVDLQLIWGIAFRSDLMVSTARSAWCACRQLACPLVDPVYPSRSLGALTHACLLWRLLQHPTAALLQPVLPLRPWPLPRCLHRRGAYHQSFQQLHAMHAD